MPLKISAFPKCYIDPIAGARTMSVFDWIDMARSLDADGLEMYDGFFTSLEPAYLDRVGEAIHAAGFAMPMLCCSPDFTNPDADVRKRALDREIEMIRVCRRLGGPSRSAASSAASATRRSAGSRAWPGWWSASTQLLPVAREHDVILGMENHYKDGFWKYPEFAQKKDVFLEIVNAIPDREYFGVQYDPSNAIVAGDDPIELLRAWPTASSPCTPATAIWRRGRRWTTCARPTARSAIRRTCGTASPARASTTTTPSSASWPTTAIRAG